MQKPTAMRSSLRIYRKYCKKLLEQCYCRLKTVKYQQLNEKYYQTS